MTTREKDVLKELLKAADELDAWYAANPDLQYVVLVNPHSAEALYRAEKVVVRHRRYVAYLEQARKEFNDSQQKAQEDHHQQPTPGADHDGDTNGKDI